MKTSEKQFSSSIDFKKLEHESYRWLYLGMVIAILMHSVALLYSAYTWRNRDAELLKTAGLKRRPIPIKMIVRKRPGGPHRGFRISPPENSKRTLTQVKRLASIPSVDNAWTKTQVFPQNELSVRDIPVHESERYIPYTEDRLIYVPEGLGLEDDGIQRIERYHISMTEEMISVDDMDHDRYKGILIIDPNDMSNVRGVLHLPVGVLPFKAKQLKHLYNYVLRDFTGISLTLDTAIHLSSREIFKYPFLYMYIGEALDLKPLEKQTLKEYLVNGGFIFMEKNSLTEISPLTVRLLFKEIFGHDRLKPLPSDHEVFHSYYDITKEALFSSIESYDNYNAQPPGVLEGIYVGKRLALVYSEHKLGNKWDQLGGNGTLSAIQMGVNIIVYALRQKGGNAVKLVDNSNSPMRGISKLKSHNPVHSVHLGGPSLLHSKMGE